MPWPPASIVSGHFLGPRAPRSSARPECAQGTVPMEGHGVPQVMDVFLLAFFHGQNLIPIGSGYWFLIGINPSRLSLCALLIPPSQDMSRSKHLWNCRNITVNMPFCHWQESWQSSENRVFWTQILWMKWRAHVEEIGIFFCFFCDFLWGPFGTRNNPCPGYCFSLEETVFSLAMKGWRITFSGGSWIIPTMENEWWWLKTIPLCYLSSYTMLSSSMYIAIPLKKYVVITIYSLLVGGKCCTRFDQSTSGPLSCLKRSSPSKGIERCQHSSGARW